MTFLRNEQIETLIELVEDRLLNLSTDRREHSPQYRDLQGCRHTLLGLAARDTGHAVTCIATERRERRARLTTIQGGKT